MPPIFSSRRPLARHTLDDTTEALAGHPAELRALFEMSPAGLALADNAGRLLRTNAPDRKSVL